MLLAGNVLNINNIVHRLHWLHWLHWLYWLHCCIGCIAVLTVLSCVTYHYICMHDVGLLFAQFGHALFFVLDYPLSANLAASFFLCFERLISVCSSVSSASCLLVLCSGVARCCLSRSLQVSCRWFEVADILKFVVDNFYAGELCSWCAFYRIRLAVTVHPSWADDVWGDYACAYMQYTYRGHTHN